MECGSTQPPQNNEEPDCPMALVDWILVAISAIVSIPIAVLACETVSAVWPQRGRAAVWLIPRPRCTVLMPAHNEAVAVSDAIAALRPQLHDADRLVVIADNCSDRTAATAREAGAEVIERHDLTRRGKGFALDFGLSFLEADPPAVVVLIDADTRAQLQALDFLVYDAQRLQAPIQGVFTDVPKSRGAREQWSAFALTFKNLVRPLGLYRLGLPCLLGGSGMAFPWPIIRKAELGTGNIVEDMKLGVDLALAGYPSNFCPEARFESDEAPTLEAATTRRTRWEHGHVATLLAQTPRLLLAGCRRLQPRLFTLGLELAVPPLSLLFLVHTLLLTIWAAWWLAGGSALPLIVLSAAGLVGLGTVLAAWAVFGRQLLSLKILCLLPVYVLWKLPIYLKLLIAPQRNWIRTERKPAS